jgi:hypothetical protein
MKLLLFLIFFTSISANNHKENDKYNEARELENIFYCINKESKQIDHFEFKEQQNSCAEFRMSSYTKCENKKNLRPIVQFDLGQPYYNNNNIIKDFLGDVK